MFMKTLKTQRIERDKGNVENFNLTVVCRPRITWLSTVQQDLKQHHLTLPSVEDDVDVWRYTIVRVACQKRRRQCHICCASTCTGWTFQNVCSRSLV